MKKKLFLMALTATALVSCSHDEVLKLQQDEIKFSIVTDNQSRAENVYCNNNLPESFNVSAVYDSKTYIDNDEISYINRSWVNNSGTRYWPNEGDVTFYAHQNTNGCFNWNETSPTIKDYAVDTDVAKQLDLIYARKTQAKSDVPVELNFHHALSQIVFKAKNTNANLYVEIEGVSVCKVGNKNTFTFPSKDTDTKVGEHNGTATTFDDTWGTWANLTSGTTTYPVTFTAVPVEGDNNEVSLTSANETGKEYSKNALLLLPQTTTKWDVASADAEGTPADQDGSYFLVKCLIYNVAGANVAKTTDVCLWGEDGKAKELAIPAAFTWEQGKKYVYTFVFGKGNGGYNPDPTDPTPEPVLVPITFDITVDDFVPVTPDNELESGIN